MDDRQTINKRRMFTEPGDELRLNPQREMSWVESTNGALPMWVAAPQGKCGSGMLGVEDGHGDRERIACLECIVAILIEKNERMRQQLQMYLD
jgi:hypothetical protein